MLEVKNLTKTYVPKKGVPVVALDHVNLKIEEKGLVFILGKSGSGKSTLLNLLGGLDKYDEGDIIIKGKSTKDFTQGNFDSYRNTYVGFIFQEYNILDEFSVGANIALAIELQGRKATNEEVNQILDTLDLQGFGNRRPNELSGGQKQRIAIARALVKKPDIILADEPTGALDSKTGMQIFEILKKLSEEKLVIVVSHDREFAETYGDRVIELADGKIISDISKTTVINGEANSPDVQYVEKEGVVVREGYKLTNKDLEMINHYLEREKRLNISYKSIEEFRTRQVFVETKEDISLKTYGAFTMIKSRLPFKMAFRMGASGLKYKKIRLFFTILLSFIAFTLFGVADSLAAYNRVDATVNSIIDGQVDAAALAKAKTITTNNYTRTIDLSLSKNDIAELNAGIGKELGITFKPVYTAGSENYDGAFRMNYNYSPSTIRNYNMYYLDSISGFAEYSKDELLDLGFTVYGNMPTKDDEIAVTDYIFEHFTVKGYGYSDEEQNIDIKAEDFNEYDDLIGKSITLRNDNLSEPMTFKVTAIVDSKFDSTRYEVLKSPQNNALNYYLSEEFRTVIQYGFHSLGFVNSGLIEKLIQNNSTLGVNLRNKANLYYYTPDKTLGFSSEIVEKLDNFGQDKVVFINQNKTKLDKGEILIDFNTFRWAFQKEIVYGDFRGSLDEYCNQLRNQLIEEYVENNYAEAEANGLFSSEYNYSGLPAEEMTEAQKIEIYLNYLNSYGYYINEFGSKSIIDLEAEVPFHLTEILNQIGTIALQKEFYNYYNYNEETDSAKIVGFFVNSGKTVYNFIIVDDDFYAEVESLGKQEPYKFAIAKMPSERSKIHKLAEFSNQTNEDFISFPMKNSATPMLDMANDLVENVAHVFLYIGIAFAVFSALMLSNFIGSSVSIKKREIGILRALGARSSDVFRIFFNESIIIALINFFFASVSTYIAVRVINNSLRSGVGLTVTVFNFSIRQIVLLLLISVFVASVASFLPVNRIAKKKPVDAIHNR